MADIAANYTNLMQSVSGGLRTVACDFISSSIEMTWQSPLNHIEYADCHGTSTSDVTFVCDRNSLTATEGETPGAVHINQLAGSNATYTLVLRGW